MNVLEPSLRVRVNQIDYSLAQSGPLDNTDLPRVPIIRIYGETSIGKKACVHVHQVYPYFFIEYTGKMNPDSVNRYIAKLNYSLNHAIAVSMKRNPHSPKSQFVRAVVLVKGVHFYGFHASYSPFLKIFIIDPTLINRAVTILRSGTVMKTRFRVYESHISFLLQFMCDFGLYGCGWMKLGEIWERGRAEIPDGSLEGHVQQESHVPFQASPHFCQSRMALELDVVAHQILNRHLLSARNIHHKLSIPAPLLSPEPLVLSVRELWEDERRRRLAKGLSPSPEIPKDPSERSRGRGADWVAEARWWDEIRKRIERERGKEKILNGGKGWERWVMTTFESIEVLWEDKWRIWKPGRRDDDVDQATAQVDVDRIQNPYAPTLFRQPWDQKLSDAEEQTEVEVDEAMLSSQAMEQFLKSEEAEWEALGEHQLNDEDVQEDDDPMEDGPLPDAQLDDDREGIDRLAQVHNGPIPSKSRKLAGSGRDSSQRSTSALPNELPQSPRKRQCTSATTPNSPPTTPTPQESQVVRPIGTTDVFSPTRPTRIANSAQPIAPSKSTPHTSRKSAKRSGEDMEGDLLELQLLKRHNSIDNISPPHDRLPALRISTIDANYIARNIGSSRSKKRSDPHASSNDSDDCNAPVKRRKIRHIADQPLQSSNSSSSSSNLLMLRATLSQDSSAMFKMHAGDENLNRYLYAPFPPSTAELLGSVDEYGIPRRVYIDPYYSRSSDAPEKPKEYAGLMFNLKGGDGIGTVDEWVGDPNCSDRTSSGYAIKLEAAGVTGWEYASCPPTARQVRKYLQGQGNLLRTTKARSKQMSQIEGPTQANPYGFKTTPPKPAKGNMRERQNMSIFSLEVFAPSRGERLPDPGEDEIVAVFYSYQDSADFPSDDTSTFSCESGMIVVENEQVNLHRLRNLQFEVVSSELDLLNRLIDLVVDIDPDIIVGWEIQASSWGFLNARAYTYGLDIGDQISRAPGRHVGGGSDQWAMRTTSTFKVVGRHVLNLWRIMRAEQTFTSYTFENVVFQILRRRVPRYSSATLTEWYNSPTPIHSADVLKYFHGHTAMVLEVLDAAEVVTKNAEFARVFGVDFFSVLSRGSQFKVESFMFRIAKPESFVLLSPSKQDVGKQNAAECMPLIMEPLSAFYNSPLIVLDFQSLYPSIMIAYNYCYSTCLGRVSDFKGQNKFGVTDLHQPTGLLHTLQEHIHVAPNGIMYVKQDVRKGLLGRMLTELLDTRVMVKQAMKGVKDDKALRRVLDARQLGLKFIANVTYGYTSATYSGRMPAVEIADSIVQSGRETLEKAIRVIDSTKKWGAKVVYGDTDSLFIYLPGKTKEQAFRIGYDMAETITAMNPAPVKLKFEKVYLPCVLMAKKRYVGFKFENPDDVEPIFDAKGIETVRRDGIPAQQKMTETCLKILFRTQDLSKVKEYCCRSWAKILENKISIQDFIFAKEVKMGTYSDKLPPPPGVTVAARRMVEDPNDEPQYGERVPYVIIRGEPGSRLVDRAVAPEVPLNNSQKHLDAAYYISRVLIPPLERIFNLVGADVRSWYDDMPKALRMDQPDSVSMSPNKAKHMAASNAFKIDEHFLSSHCINCGALTLEGICDDCRAHPQTTISGLLSRLWVAEGRLRNVQTVCSSCCGTAPAEPVKCESLDCPWLFERKKIQGRADSLTVIEDLINGLEEGEPDDAT